MSTPNRLALNNRSVCDIVHPHPAHVPIHQQQTAIANSAGPDSTCLLFLLRRMIDWQPKNNAALPPGAGPHDLPDNILSLHVNHNLQSDAKKMAHAAGSAAKQFKAVHSELRVPWGELPFPPRPRLGMDSPADAVDAVDAGAGADDDTPIESVARIARYRLLFDEMLRRRVHVLATGHHADDQVETVLMRLGSGSSALGLGGMRPVRRFGMAMGKNEGDFGWFGHEGLDRWIVRPLLDVPKVRHFFVSLESFSCLTNLRVWSMFFLGQNSRDLRVA